MSDYKLSRAARRDYFAAFEYIAQHSLSAALKWEAALLEALDHLAEWPKTGRIRPEYAPAPIRFWVTGDYLILYHSETDPVRIYAILHGAQELSSLIAARMTDPEPEP